MRSGRLLVVVACMVGFVALPCIAQDAPMVDETVPPQESILLRFNYEEGETLTYETKVDGVGSVHVMGQAQAVAMSGVMYVMMKVEEIDEDGNFIMVTEVDIAELAVSVAGSPVPPPQQDISMRTTMSPRGEILNIELVQTVNQRMCSLRGMSRWRSCSPAASTSTG